MISKIASLLTSVALLCFSLALLFCFVDIFVESTSFQQYLKRQSFDQLNLNLQDFRR